MRAPEGRRSRLMPLLTLAALASVDSCKRYDQPEVARPALNFCSVPASTIADAHPAIATQSLSPPALAPAANLTPHFKDHDKAVWNYIEVTEELRVQVALVMLKGEAAGARRRGKPAEAYGFEKACIEKGDSLGDLRIIINGIRYGILRMKEGDKIVLFGVGNNDHDG